MLFFLLTARSFDDEVNLLQLREKADSLHIEDQGDVDASHRQESTTGPGQLLRSQSTTGLPLQSHPSTSPALQSQPTLLPGKHSSLIHPNRLLYIGIVSAPKNRDRRDLQRRAYVTALRKAPRSPNGKDVHVEFVIGHTPFQSAAQGSMADKDQLELERNLTKEQQECGDLARVVLPEHDENLPDKTFLIVTRAVERGWQWILKIDDDTQPHLAEIYRFINGHNPSDSIYAGRYLIDKRPWQGQGGPDNHFRQYYEGPSYMLSYGLGYSLAIDNEGHAAEFLTYGSSDEDVDMGQWVAYVQEHGSKVEWSTFALSQRVAGAPQS